MRAAACRPAEPSAATRSTGLRSGSGRPRTRPRARRRPGWSFSFDVLTFVQIPRTRTSPSFAIVAGTRASPSAQAAVKNTSERIPPIIASISSSSSVQTVFSPTTRVEETVFVRSSEHVHGRAGSANSKTRSASSTGEAHAVARRRIPGTYRYSCIAMPPVKYDAYGIQTLNGTDQERSPCDRRGTCRRGVRPKAPVDGTARTTSLPSISSSTPSSRWISTDARDDASKASAASHGRARPASPR